jgi:sulfite exporter TauE/SafE
MRPEVLPLAVLGLALLGSPHCLMMCGVLCLGSSENGSRGLAFYHFGRLISYLVLGGLAGALGAAVLFDFQKPVFFILGALLGLTFIVSGIHLMLAKQVSISEVGHRIVGQVLVKTNSVSREIRPLFIGLASGLLPCGFLYTFVLAAVSTKSSMWGAGLLFCFWLGTVPALSTAVYLVRTVRKLGSAKMQKSVRVVVAGLFILYGSTVLLNRIDGFQKPKILNSLSAPNCHGEPVSNH